MKKRAPDEISPKQERFCQEYLKDLNATQAAIRAGYTRKNAHKVGPRLVGKSGIASRLNELIKRRSRRYEITGERILKELARIAYSDITDYLTFNESGIRMRESSELRKSQTAAIAEVSEVLNQYGGTTKFKLHDKTRALELLGKYQKLFTDKVEHSGSIRLEDLIAGSQRDDGEDDEAE